METINLEETMSIINYGVNTQNKLSELSECAFDIIRKIEISSIGVLEEVLEMVILERLIQAVEMNLNLKEVMEGVALHQDY